MLKFKAWRYQCEFCGKNSRSASAMKKHERGCTANPDRECKMHKYLFGEDVAIPPVIGMVRLLQELRDSEDHGLGRLRSAANNCPACILAALRQSGFCKGTGQDTGHMENDEYVGNLYQPPLIGKEQFDFIAESKEALDDENQRRREKEVDAERNQY